MTPRLIPRFFSPEPLSQGGIATLSDEAAHHAVRVLRLGPDDRVSLFDGRGGVWTARILRLKPTVQAALEVFDDEDREPPLQVTLVQSLPSGDKMDWVVQKAVELGVAALAPVTARRSVIRLSGERIERRIRHWQGVAGAACEQCGRNRVPPVASLLDLPQYLGQPARENETRLLLSPTGGRRLRDLPPPPGPVALLIGPEGGLEESEMAAARTAGFEAVTFGPRILRTETAGPAALAAMMALWGDV